MKLNKYFAILVLLCNSFYFFGQNLVFSYEIISGSTTSTINYYVHYPVNGGPTESEAIYGYTCAIFYDNTLTSPPATFGTAWVDAPLGWSFDGAYSQFIPNSSIPGYSGYVEVSKIDANLNGTLITEGAAPFLLGTLVFNHLQSPAGNAFIASSTQLPGIAYLSASGDEEHTIQIDGVQFGPLPISIKSFDAIKHSASSAKLDWTTSKEVNSDYFGIERSIDGSTWDEIARVNAAGDSNVDIAYDYIDDRLPLSRRNGQVFYYRLRMTDLDGAFKFSDVRGVNFDKQALGPISIYPNPTTEIVNIDLSEVVMEDGDVYVSVSVYDMSGRLVMTKQIIGSGIELIKVDQLPSDAYNFIIRQGEQIHQQRVIKID